MSIVVVFAIGIGVMNEQSKNWARIAHRGILQHRLVAIAVAETHHGATADKLVDADRLACLVVHEQESIPSVLRG